TGGWFVPTEGAGTLRRTISGWCACTVGAGRGVGATTNVGRRTLGEADSRLPPAAALAPGKAKGCGAIGALAICSWVTGITRRAIGSPLRNVVIGTTVMARRRFRYSTVLTLTVTGMLDTPLNMGAFFRRRYSPPW